MRKVWMQARKDFDTRGHVRKAGDVFEAAPLDALVLSHQGYAGFTKAPAAPVVQVTATKSVTHEEAKPDEAQTGEATEAEGAAEPNEDGATSDVDGPRGRRRYRRRDISVEEAG